MIRFWFRNYRIVLVFLAVLTVPAAHYSAKLYGNLKPDLEELLPKRSRTILDLEEVRTRLRSIQKLDILISSSNGEAGRRFQDDLAHELLKLPESEISGVEYRIDRELKFFSDRKSLFLDLEDLKAIRRYARERITYEQILYNPLTIFSEIYVPEPEFDFRAIESKYSQRSSQYSHFPDGYYSLADGTGRLVTAYLPGKKTGINGATAFKAEIAEIIARLKPTSYASDLEIHYTGTVQDLIEEYLALVGDIERSAFIVFALVFGALLLFFRSILATGALIVSLLMARFWTFGLSWFTVGSLNANSAFMGSIVLGSGITFGVMLLARYMEERRKKKGPVRSAYIAMRNTMRATSASALCAGFAYGSLFLTEFEGFRQYGIIGLAGMVLCWVSSVFMLPGLLLEIERRKWYLVKRTKPRASPIFGLVTRILRRYPRAIVAGSICLTLVSLLGLSRFDSDRILEKDLSKLRNRESMKKGSGFYGKKVDAILMSPSSPLVVLAHSKEAAEQVTQKLKEQQRNEGSKTLMLQIADINQFIPDRQVEKIAVLKDIRKILPKSILSQLGPADRVKAQDILNPKGFAPITLTNLPPLVKEKFTEKNGSIGNLVLVDPLEASSLWSGPQLNKFVGDIRKTADEVEGRRVPVAGSLTVTSDMIASITRDGPRATLFALLSVTILIFLLFRNLSTSLTMLSTLIVGSIWMMGVILWLNLKINFLNFIVFPITFGIGVDYGVNIFQRYLREPSRDILYVVRETGGAVGLCSFTTIIGYSSLLLAKNNGFVNFGLFAVIGEIACLLAAVMALPAWVVLRDRRKRPDTYVAVPKNETTEQATFPPEGDSPRLPMPPPRFASEERVQGAK